MLPLVNQTSPDVCLLDMHMPEMDGLTCIERLRKQHPDVKTIILSAFADRARVDDALGRGADAYVAKSIKPAALADLLRRVHAGESFDAGVDDAAPSAGERAGRRSARRRFSPHSLKDYRTRRSAQALDHRADGEVPPDEHLSQARRREPHRRCSLRVRERAQRVTYGDRELALLESSERRLVRLAFDLHDGAAGSRRARDRTAALSHADGRERRPPRARTCRRLRSACRRDRARSANARPLAECAGAHETPLAELVRSESRGARVSGRTRDARDPRLGGVVHAFASHRLDPTRASRLREHPPSQRSACGVLDDHVRGQSRPARDRRRRRGVRGGADARAATRRGRLGLAGMRERIRLLDGSLDISSRRGGPTTISVVVPRWRGTQTPPEASRTLAPSSSQSGGAVALEPDRELGDRPGVNRGTGWTPGGRE